MTTHYALHDKRVRVQVPNTPTLTVLHTNRGAPLHPLLSRIAEAGKNKPVQALFIIAHGVETNWNFRDGVCHDPSSGGRGIALGEGVRHTNVSNWTILCNRVRNIVVYSCGAANTADGNQGSEADGYYLMGALAIHTNADVYASSSIQIYNQNRGGVIRMGQWEGEVFRFPPTGAPPQRVRNAPFELDMVLAGR